MIVEIKNSKEKQAIGFLCLKETGKATVMVLAGNC